MNLQLQELNFTLIVNNLSPIDFDLNNLQKKGIIKAEWKLAEDPIYSDSGVKLVFTNQVRIIAQPQRIIFAETIGKKRLQDILLPTMLNNCWQAFPEIDYQRISINPGGYVKFDSNLESCQYLSKGLLAATSWQKFQGQEITGVGLKLAYPCKTGMFYLEIDQANVEVAGSGISAVWFAGSFNYQLLGQDSIQRKRHLASIIQDWDTDLNNFCDFINNELLAVSIMPSVSLFPL